jgi:glycine/D-amino acid oxidase-like deaminating enzyme
MSNTRYQHAIVIGGSIAGLLTARALSEHALAAPAALFKPRILVPILAHALCRRRKWFSF